MNEFTALRSRVEETAARLAAAQCDRRDRNQSLLATLGRLEAKFASQEEELAYYRDRIRPLEAANMQLSALMGRLLDMVDGGLGNDDDAEDPVRIATAMAAAMLDRDLIPLAEAPLAELAHAGDAGPFAEDAVAGYEDVDGETLASELAGEDEGAELPSLVRVAAAVAAVEPEGDFESVEALADALSGQADDADPLHPTAGDIRALLERVEAAAAQIRVAHAEAPSRTDQVATLPSRRSADAAA